MGILAQSSDIQLIMTGRHKGDDRVMVSADIVCQYHMSRSVVQMDSFQAVVSM